MRHISRPGAPVPRDLCSVTFQRHSVLFLVYAGESRSIHQSTTMIAGIIWYSIDHKVGDEGAIFSEVSRSNTYRGVSFRPRPHCGSKRKCIRIVLMRTVEKGRKHIKIRVCSMCIEFNLRYNVQFYRFRTFHEKCEWTVKTYQKGSVDANRSMRFCILLKTHQCGQGHSYT